MGMISIINIAVVEAGIWSLWGLLTCVDFVLAFWNKLIGGVASPMNGTTNPPPSSQQQLLLQQRKTKVVIVGCSFAGLTAYRDLQRHADAGDNLDVTLIDYKDYFEYTPGILRCFVDPNYHTTLTCPLSIWNRRPYTKFLQGEVVQVDSVRKVVKLKNGRQEPYDYLILATGSTYPGVIKASPAVPHLAARQVQIRRSFETLKNARSVIVVGAGAVGVELVGEILERYPHNKRVVLCDMSSTILPGFRDETTRYAKQWLINHGVEMRLGSPLQSIGEASVTFQDGSTLYADVVYRCIGAIPAPVYLYSDSIASATFLQGPKGSIVVNDNLLVDGSQQTIFSAGDVCFHATSNELKLAHTAHVSASLVALNVLRLIRSKDEITTPTSPRLLKYPDGLHGTKKTPKVYIVSLGKYDATMAFNGLVIHGPLAAVSKYMIEWTQVAAAADCPVGILFWMVADWASFFLSKTILPTEDERKMR